MSTRLDVLAALKALIVSIAPGADVKGLDNDAEFPTRIPPNGLWIVREGDPGEPDVVLSPLTYIFDHRIPVEVAGYESSSQTSSEVLDSMLMPFGAAIAADRTLGGLCDFVDVEAPDPDDITSAGAKPVKGAIIIVVATYATSTPLN